MAINVTPVPKTLTGLRLLLPSVAALVLLAAPAASAATSCKTMIEVFDSSTPEKAGGAKAAAAKKQRNAGAAALAKGNQRACREHLTSALTAIGTGASDKSDSQPDKVPARKAPKPKS